MVDFLEIIEHDKIDYLQFQFTTLFGEFKAVEFPSSIWEDMKNGTGIDGSSLGYLKTEQSDMKIVPDLTTFSILPWNNRIGRFICDITDNHGNAYPLCPRGILKRVIKTSNSRGYEFFIRPELEWYFITASKIPGDSAGYMDIPPKDRYSSLRYKIADDIIKMKIGIKTIHHEGGPGQQEIEFLPNKALIQADNIQTAKMIVKIDSAQEGIIASFMPKLFDLEAGNGLHIHQYLMAGDKNCFTDEKKPISDNLRFYIGGIQKHCQAITAILNPTTNSYKRLIPNHEAPVFNAWGIGNRTALLRVPGYETLNRVEYRGGDASMNIYLGTAILLAAGLDGIKNKIEPNMPTDKNVDVLSDLERKELGIKSLPGTLEESIRALKQSSFLKKIFGKEFIELYLTIKEKELTLYKDAEKSQSVAEWEFNRYIDV